MECKNSEVSILFTDDREIQKLNADYRGMDKPTDVLTFRLSESKEPNARHIPLGDVVISIPTAKRQAREFDVSLQEELLRLLIHGLLHLLGYEHEGVSRSVAARMQRLEKSLFVKYSSQQILSARRRK